MAVSEENPRETSHRAVLRRAAPYGLVLVVALVAWGSCGQGAGVMRNELAEVTITDQDTGGNITLATDQRLVVRLKAALGTGFSWQIAAHDPRILEPAGPPQIMPPE
ncbi:MAG TPA: hypothetical protein VLK82_22315, partial [Candidatus Tectomicrobia bacterium]|nr:hypothetical protein [Candidatus Tectomicrobia bacterium]